MLACLGGLVPAKARADYIPVHLNELILSADLIATGQIVEVREKTYIFRLDEVLVGERKEVVEVRRFQDWVCAWRWAKYEVGERLLLFAEKNDGRFVAIGAACEGECPLSKADVYCHFVNGLEPREKVGESTMPKVAWKEMRTAILDYRAYFKFGKQKRDDGVFPEIVPPMSERAMKSFAERSSIHKLLAQDTKRIEERELRKNR